ncbi:MAG: AAA family ATPase [archaeon]
MISTGCKELDELFTYDNHITGIYGKPATGKTTLCLLAMAKVQAGKKIVFIDTENSFSLERLKQFNPEIKLDNFFVMPVKSFTDQHKTVENLLKIKNKISFIIIDSFSMFYRRMLQEKTKVNILVARQLSILNEIAKEGIPIIITCQVYSKLDGTIELIGRDLIRNWCSTLILLEEKGIRTLYLEKHPTKKSDMKNFVIRTEEIIFSSS